MNKSHGWSAATLLMIAFGCLTSPRIEAQTTETLTPFPGGKEADLWLLAGQSNMLGCGLLKGPTEPDPRIMTFTKDKRWVVSEEPLHEERKGVESQKGAEFPIREHILLQRYGVDFPNNLTPQKFLDDLGDQPKHGLEGVGPGLFFARHLIQYTNRPIGLIFCAQAGTWMDMWSPDLKKPSDLYPFMMERVRAVGAPIKGMLWYQGEGDAGGPNFKDYEKKFENLINTFRRDIGNPDLPFIIVQISRWPWPQNDGEPNAQVSVVREAQRQIARRLKNVYTVSSIDLPMDDFIHVAYEGQQRLGKRLAEVAMSKAYNMPGHGQPIDVEKIEMLHPEKERSIIRVKFSGVSGRLKSADRPNGFRIICPDPAVNRVIYRVDFDPNDPSAVLLGIYTSFKSTAEDTLMCGPGWDPYVNITDEKDMAIPAFGPIALPIAETFQSIEKRPEKSK